MDVRGIHCSFIGAWPDKLLSIACSYRSIVQYWAYGKTSQLVRCITLQPACYWIPLYTRRSIGLISHFTTGSVNINFFSSLILNAVPCVQNGILYAHFFRLDLQNALLWHGMAIPHTRFNIRSAQYWPKPEYLQWHYRQCLMARMRGFSA
jgi:hypothetical protein